MSSLPPGNTVALFATAPALSAPPVARESPQEHEDASRNLDEQSQCRRCLRPSATNRTHPDVQCGACAKSFHQSCLNPPLPGPVLNGDLAYKFECASCSDDGLDHFDPSMKQWASVVRLIFYNLALSADGDWDRGWTREEILSFFETHIYTLTAGRSFNRETFVKAIMLYCTKDPYRCTRGLFTTRERCSIMVRAEQKHAPKRKARERDREDGNDDYDPKAGRRARRPRDKSGTRSKDRRRRTGEERERAAPLKTIIHIQPTVLSWRKSAAVRFTSDLADCAPQLKIADDGLTLSGQKGYRMGRASHFVWTGGWYFEVTILDGKGMHAQRLGWSTGKGDLQAPVGYDRFSYSIRSTDGQAFHRSIGKPYGRSFGTGDVVGCYIYLPPQAEYEVPELEPPQPIPVMVQGRGARAKVTIMQPERAQRKPITEDEKLLSSEVRFFVNGVDQGVAFSGLTPGGYHPAISLWSNKDGISSVRVNMGPNFMLPPPNNLPGGPPQPVSAIGPTLFSMFPPPVETGLPVEEPAPEAAGKRSKKVKAPRGREEEVAATASAAAAAAAAASLPQAMVSAVTDAVLEAAGKEDDGEGDADGEGEEDDAVEDEDVIETLTASSSDEGDGDLKSDDDIDGKEQLQAPAQHPTASNSHSLHTLSTPLDQSHLEQHQQTLADSTASQQSLAPQTDISKLTTQAAPQLFAPSESIFCTYPSTEFSSHTDVPPVNSVGVSPSQQL